MVTFLQGLCTALIIVEYFGQISKLIKKKKVSSLSWTYWITKNLITMLQIITLFLSGAVIEAYFSQIMSLILCMIVFSLMVFYYKKGGK